MVASDLPDAIFFDQCQGYAIVHKHIGWRRFGSAERHETSTVDDRCGQPDDGALAELGAQTGWWLKR